MERLLFILVLCCAARHSLQTQELLQPQIYSLHVLSNIHYRYAHTSVSSEIANPANISQEVTFNMILPETAFISGFSIEVGGNSYDAYVKENEEAKTIYAKAKSRGQTAGHIALSVRNSNRFAVSLNVKAEERITFNLTYEELLVRKLGVYKHIINLDPGQIVSDFRVEVHIKESNRITKLEVPALKKSAQINNDITADVTNPFASIKYPTLDTAIVTFTPTKEQQEEVDNNGIRGQLIVQYDLDRLKHPNELLVNDGYFAHFFTPENLKPLSKHVTFVLDVSYSMEGHKLTQLKEAMDAILTDLRAGDYFSLIIFATYVEVWNFHEHGNWELASTSNNNWKKLVLPANARTIRKAKAAIQRLKVRGATNIYHAMKISTHIAFLGKDMTNGTEETMRLEPIIIFLTDGEPTKGPGDLDKIIIDTTTWNRKSKASIFTLALGESANLEFLKKLSLRNSGYALKIYEATDTALQLREFYQQVASPLAADVLFTYQPDQIEMMSLTQHSFVNFYSGSELVVSGRLTDATPGQELSYAVTGRTPDGTMYFEPEQATVVDHGFIERLWAYLSIQQLLDEEKISYGTNSETSKRQAVELALKYSFVTPVTSLVVVIPSGSNERVGSEREELVSGIPKVAENSFNAHSYEAYDDDDYNDNHMYTDINRHSASRRISAFATVQLLQILIMKLI
ncbi:inter-alpha-trypsin inhibitor heavy chain H4-like [Periplaneta americana]|uniref:inter-alpha-trypsin inhibitor heavy chain H4-like n=1 Tax=Periplaneta americana TaxID=6978 RepID=UPI0037E80133